MAELDDLIDSLIGQRVDSETYELDDKHVKTLELRRTPSKGQGVFAKKSMSVHDPVCSLSYPTIMAIDTEFLRTTCYHCLVVTAPQLPLPGYGHASVELKTCNGCQLARFCNRDCQVQAWHAYHKYECKVFKKMQHNLPPAMFRVVMRAVLLKDRNLIPEKQWNRITSLVSHEQVLGAPSRSEDTAMAEGIQHLAQSGMTTDAIRKLIFIMKSNATELPSTIYGGMGIMLDFLIGKVNHSCEPNVAIYRPQHTMTSGWMKSGSFTEDQKDTFAQLIPLRDIQEGEEILNCYVVPTTSVTYRNAVCREQYYFDCKCPKCLSDTKAAELLAEEHPPLPAEFERWSERAMQHISQMKTKSTAFAKAVKAMDQTEQFYEYPTLYTTGNFPLMSMRMILEGLKRETFDEALINALRVHFLVNSSRFVGRHNPTVIYTVFVLLDIFDAVLGISATAATSTSTSNSDSVNSKIPTEAQRKNWLHSLSARGLSRAGLVYWRQKLCSDLRQRVENCASRDLLILVGKREELNLAIDANEKKNRDSDTIASSTIDKTKAEEEMRTALRLQPSRWELVLQQQQQQQQQ